MLNILVSTTRQWNCGDELILFGVINLIEKKYSDKINWVIYNRNPDVVESKNQLSNNWKNQSLSKIDKIIIAGTPEWFGRPLEPLFRQMVYDNKTGIFLGIGYITNTIGFSQLDKEVLNKSELIITRDSFAKNCCKNIGIDTKILPCPCLFASKKEKFIKNNKIGVVYQSNKTINQSTNLKSTLDELIKTLDTDVICHYTDEYFEAIEKYKTVYYSFDSKEYLEIYKEFDLIISSRLHGAITALACGVPAILLTNDDPRLVGAAQVIPIMHTACSVGEVLNLINTIDLKEISKKILIFKERVENEYLNLL